MGAYATAATAAASLAGGAGDGTPLWATLLAGGAAATIGAVVAYAFNARLKELDFWEARRTARRAEKREVYREVLAYAVGARRFWERVADFGNIHFDAIGVLREAKGPEDGTRREDLAAALDLVRAEDVARAFERFCAAVDQCRLGYIDGMQRAGINTAEDAEPRSVHVGGARTAVNEQLRGVRDRYPELRDLMREEIYPEEDRPPTLRGLLSRRGSDRP